MSIVYTGGTFDVLHIGHVSFLKKCAQLGEVVVALNTDEFIEMYKGQKPLYNFEERFKHLASCPYVSEIIPNFGGNDSKPVIEEVAPDFLVVGSDWAKKDYYKQMGFTQEWLDQHGITLIYVPYYDGISTSDIKKRVSSRTLQERPIYEGEVRVWTRGDNERWKLV